MEAIGEKLGGGGRVQTEGAAGGGALRGRRGSIYSRDDCVESERSSITAECAYEGGNTVAATTKS